MVDPNFRKVFMPYCLQRQENGLYAILNRNYKPVGVATTGILRLKDHPGLVNLKGLTAKKASKISFEGLSDLDAIYLYDGGNAPESNTKRWEGYNICLKELSKIPLILSEN